MGIDGRLAGTIGASIAAVGPALGEAAKVLIGFLQVASPTRTLAPAPTPPPPRPDPCDLAQSKLDGHLQVTSSFLDLLAYSLTYALTD